MREVILQKSSNPKKKYDAYIEGKKVSFGAIRTSPNIRMKKGNKDI